MTLKVGIMAGWEESFPRAFIEKVNAMGKGAVTADFIKFGGQREAEVSDYSVIVDRISHEVLYYRMALKIAALGGTYCINNPFWWQADDKFFGYSLAKRLGVAVPKTMLLPQKSYPPGIVPDRSLRNLKYPLDWEAIFDYVGFPAFLKPADGGGWRDVYRVNNPQEFFDAYDRSKTLCMTLQEFIDFDLYVRCVCIGREFILPIRYDPKEPHIFRRYKVEHNFMNAETGKRVVEDALKLNLALGYDMNSVEFAFRDGIPYAIDFTNPAPDMHVESLTEHYFPIVVDRMADLAIRAAKEGRKNPELRFDAMLKGNDPVKKVV
jgi:hypothetical protein